MVPMRHPVAKATVIARSRQSPNFPLLLRQLHVLPLSHPMHPLEVQLPPPDRILALEDLVRTLTAMSLERLDDLPHHPEQLPGAIYLPWTVMLRAQVPIERPTDPSFRELLLPQ
jgi:hypothetical protein